MESIAARNLLPTWRQEIEHAETIMTQTLQATTTDFTTILDWLRHEFGIEKPGAAA